MRRKSIVYILFAGVVFVFLVGFTAQFTRSLQVMSITPGMIRYVRSFDSFTNLSLDLSTKLNTSINSMFRPVVETITNAKQPKKRYHVLINSYMNCGSRFTGNLFGFRSDAFYFYEPLWKFSVWDYYDVPDKACSSTNGPLACRKTTVEALNKHRLTNRHEAPILKNVPKGIRPIDMLTSVLDDIYRCNFSRLEHLIVPKVQDDLNLAGPSWRKFGECMRARINRLECIKRQEVVCREARHVVTKVLRLTTDSLDAVMERNPNLKVIQLFRDPRAIINSRMESKGYPTKDHNINSKNLCNKMSMDFEGGLRLRNKYPERFKFAFYDDIKVNVTDRMEALYDFVGMDMNIAELNKINKVKTNAAISRSPAMNKNRVQDNAGWWRSHLPFTRYQTIEENCKNVAGHFGLRNFRDRNEIMNIAIPSLNLNNILKIK